jgi:hypothetical protein
MTVLRGLVKFRVVRAAAGQNRASQMAEQELCAEHTGPIRIID